MPLRTTPSSRPSTRRRSHIAGRSLAVAAAVVLTAGIAGPALADTAAQPDSRTVATPFEASNTADTSTSAEAAAAVTAARTLAGKADGKVDTVELGIQISQLDDAEALPQFVVAAFTDMLVTTTGDVQKSLAAYEKKKAAAAAALKNANTRSGAKATARAMAADEYGWGAGQFSCLDSLWTKESGWNYKAYNRGSGATGIPQSLPGSKMATAGADWKTSAATQIKWGLAYIDRAYGSPCAAWGHSQSTNWY